MSAGGWPDPPGDGAGDGGDDGDRVDDGWSDDGWSDDSWSDLGRRPGRKLRSEETWAEVRRGWERGETAASLARRYDVGLSNLWRRRAAEGWRRRAGADPEPEPLEGWARAAGRRREAFERGLEATRELAGDLAAMMKGAPMTEAPLWHLAFLYHWRAGRLGPETAALDRERMRDRDWAGAVWDEAGGLRPLHEAERALARLHRAEWRAAVGLPDGVVEAWP